MRTFFALLFGSLIVLSGGAAAAEVRVLGLFTGKAILQVDGTRRTLSVGETSPEGIRLLGADSDTAVLEIDGKRTRRGLDSRIGGSYRQPEKRLVRIWPDVKGMYSASGGINGFPVDFLVDTGATTIAMNAAHARRLGIAYRLKGTPGMVETASGLERVYRVTLDTVRVGEILLRNVDAVVLDGGRPSQILLGMSFLGRLDMERTGGALLLKQRW